MMNPTLRLEKIEYKLDYFTECSICHKKLKKAYITNQGVMGIDCFMEQIGKPIIRSQTKKSPVLPVEQYESLAVQLVATLKSVSNDSWKAMIGKFYGSELIQEVKRATFKFSIRFKTGLLKEINVLILHKQIISELGQLPMDMMDKIIETKAYSQLYFESIRENQSTAIFYYD